MLTAGRRRCGNQRSSSPWAGRAIRRRPVHAAADAQVRAVDVRMTVGEHVPCVPRVACWRSDRRRDEPCPARGRRPDPRAPPSRQPVDGTRESASVLASHTDAGRPAVRSTCSAPARRAAPTCRAEIDTVSTPASAAIAALASVHASSTTTIRTRTAPPCRRSTSARLRRSAARQCGSSACSSATGTIAAIVVITR